MTEAVAVRYATPTPIRTADVMAKGLLVAMLLMAVVDPDGSNLRDKAAEARAIGYPLVSFTVPLIWLLAWKERASFPWLADLLVTLTCFTDVLGNRMDLYDTIVWFDDLMHFANTGLIDNLPQDACVEVPVWASRNGFEAIRIGALPRFDALVRAKD